MGLDYNLLKGSFTAVITPFRKDLSIDSGGFSDLLNFQKKYGNKCVIMGTTAESPTVEWFEHLGTIETAVEELGPENIIAGTGSNSTMESVKATSEACDLGVKAVLVVDCYYNKPSSASLFKNYYSVLADSFPETLIMPYIIPGRSVTQLSVPHLILLAETFDNVRSVKEASGDLERMKLTRSVALSEGFSDFSILSGDDNMTYAMMSDEMILANGVISVYSNVFPKAVHDMVLALQEKDFIAAGRINKDLNPLFELVGLRTVEKVRLRNGVYSVENKFPNPEPVKALMNILGMPAGFCRPPLNGLDETGLKVLKRNALKVYETSPEYFEPLVEFFKVSDIREKLA